VFRKEDAISHTGQSNCELRLKGGRPKGSIDAEKKVTLNALTAANTDCAVINSDTIRRRVAWNRFVVNQLGAVFPLASIEIAVVGIIIQMARIH